MPEHLWLLNSNKFSYGKFINTIISTCFHKLQKHNIELKSPISALNLKNPGPITSLLQSYTASTTYKKTISSLIVRNISITQKTQVQVHNMAYLLDHFSRNEEPYLYLDHPLPYQLKHGDSSGLEIWPPAQLIQLIYTLN